MLNLKIIEKPFVCVDLRSCAHEKVKKVNLKIKNTCTNAFVVGINSGLTCKISNLL